MSWEGITTIIIGIGLLITIGGLVYSRGNMDARFKVLEDRVKEDREKNASQHAEFYETSRCVEGVKAEVSSLSKSLDEARKDIREILDIMRKAS
jgi:hypothetical protein